MIMKKLFFFFLLPFLFSQTSQEIDGVAAIIEEHIVLKSDLAQMINMSIIQNRLDPKKDIEKIKKLKNSVLESMIDQKIILKKAELDSVVVDEKEVDLALDQQIQMLVSQSSFFLLVGLSVLLIIRDTSQLLIVQRLLNQ